MDISAAADNKPEIIPEQAEVVREIYARYLAGASLRMIQEWLIVSGIPSALFFTFCTIRLTLKPWAEQVQNKKDLR